MRAMPANRTRSAPKAVAHSSRTASGRWPLQLRKLTLVRPEFWTMKISAITATSTLSETRVHSAPALVPRTPRANSGVCEVDVTGCAGSVTRHFYPRLAAGIHAGPIQLIN